MSIDSLSLWIYCLLKLSMGKVTMVNVRNKFELKFSLTLSCIQSVKLIQLVRAIA